MLSSLLRLFRRDRARQQFRQRKSAPPSTHRQVEYLEDRELLTVDLDLTANSIEFQLSYDSDQQITSLEDIYLQTNASGNLEYSTDGSSFTEITQTGGETYNLSDGSLTTLDVSVTFNPNGDDELADLYRNLFDGDSVSKLFLRDITAPHVDLDFSALEINQADGYTISTRTTGAGADPESGASTGDSGDLNFNSPKVILAGEVFSHVGDGDVTNTAGDIDITAVGNLDDISSVLLSLPIPVLPDLSITRASVDLTGVTVRGRDISVYVESDASDLFDDDDTPGGMGEPVAEFFGSLSAGVGVAISQATAELNIDGATIFGNEIDLEAQSATDAEATVLTIFAAYAYGQSEPKAEIDIRNGSRITATGGLDITTFADSDMNIIATQNLVGTSTTTEKYNVTAVGAYSNLVSSASLSSDSSLNVGTSLNVDVGGTREHNTQSNAAAYNDGTLAIALNVAVHNATLEALIDGTVVTQGDMTVDAELETLKNDYNATSTVGTGELGGRLQSGRAGGVLRAFTKGFNFFFPTGGGGGRVGGEWGRLLNAAKPQGVEIPAEEQGTPNKFDLSGAINAGLSFNEIDVRIGDGASVDVGGDLVLRGHVEEFPETSAISFLNSSNSFLPDAPRGTYSQRETGLAGAVTGGYFQNNVDVYVGAGARVVVDGDFSILSESSIPYDPQYVWDVRADSFEPIRFSTLTDKFNYNLGIQNGFFSSWAEAIAGAESKAIGVMVNILLGNSQTYAYIGDGAEVIVGGDLIVSADSAIDTINFVGSPLLPFNATAGRGIGAALMTTGYINDIEASINPLAKVTADSALVFANNCGKNISLGIQGGLSDGREGDDFFSQGSGGFNGVFTSTFVDNRTISKISPSAELNLRDGLVEVPVPFEELRQDARTVTTTVAEFNPNEPYDGDDTTLRRVDADSNTITLPFDHYSVTGSPLIYDNDGGTDIGGLNSGQIYYAIVNGDDEPHILKLALTYQDAIDGNAIDLDLDDLDGVFDQYHSLYQGFDPTDPSRVLLGSSTIDLGNQHNLLSGIPVLYDTDGEAPIGNLTPGSIYYVSVTGANTYRLANTAAEAIEAEVTGDTSSLITFAAGATGRGHSLRPTAYEKIEDPELPRVLDTNQDGLVNSTDDYVTGVNSFIATGGTLNVQTDTNLLVLANDQTNLFNGSGVLTKTTSSASGGAINVNVINRRTEALIGSEDRVLDEDDFTPELGIDSSGLITLDYTHGFTAGDELVYTAGGDYPIDGLRDRGLYVVTSGQDQEFRIGRTEAEATRLIDSTDVNGTTWTIDLGDTHKFQSGDAVRYTNDDPTTHDDIGGLTDGQVYYVIAVDGTKIQLAQSVEDVADQFRFQFTPATSITGDLLYLGYAHGLPAGQLLLYRSGGGAAVGGLQDGQTYEVVLDSDEPLGIKLKDLTTGRVVTMDPAVARGVSHTLQPAFTQEDVATTAKDILTNTIDLGYAHDLQTGDAVQLSGAASLGLTDGQRYFAIVLTDTTLALAESETLAESGRTQYFLSTELLDNGDAAAGRYDTIDVYVDHGFQNGDTVLYVQGSSLDVGLTDGETYTVRLLDPDTTTLDLPETKLQLLDSNGVLVEFDSPAGTDSVYGSLVNLSARAALTGGTATDPVYLFNDARIELTQPSAATDAYAFQLAIDPLTTLESTHGFAPTFDPSLALTDTDDNDYFDTIDLGYTHNYAAGQEVIYTSGVGSPIIGLNEGQVYFVRLVSGSSTRIQLAETRLQATEVTADPQVVEFETSQTTGTTHAVAARLRPVSTLDAPTDTIRFTRVHGFSNGDQITYTAGDGGSIGGLNDGDTYIVLTTTDPRVIQLSTDGTTPLTLTAPLVSGGGHTFSDLVVSGTVSITTENDVVVASANTGSIIAVTAAATVATPAKTNAYTGAGWSASSTTWSDATANDGGGNVSGTMAVNIQVDRTLAWVQDTEFFGSGGLFVNAINEAEIYMGAGAVTFASVDGQRGGGSGSMAGALAVNVIGNRTEAWVDGSTVTRTGDVIVDADSRGNVIAIAISGAGSTGSLAAGGSIVVNVISMNTIARVTDSIIVTPAALDVRSKNNSDALAVAGAFAAVGQSKNATASGTTAIGFAVSINIISNDLRDGGTLSYVENSTIDVGDNLDIVALADSSTIAVVAAMAFNVETGGASKSVAIGLGLNVISTRTRASLRGTKDDQDNEVDGNVTVSADDTSLTMSFNFPVSVTFTGGGGTSSSAAGAGLTFNVINTDIQADISGTVLDAQSIDVTAVGDGTVQAIALGFSGAEDNAFAGQLAFNYIEQDVTALVASSSVTTSGDMSVTAEDESEIFALTGAAALALSGNSGTGVGAALSFGITNNTTEAIVDQSVIITGGDLLVDATSQSTIETVTAGAAAGRQLGVGGSVSTIVLANETRAAITSSTVTSSHNVLVTADQSGIVRTYAGALGFG